MIQGKEFFRHDSSVPQFGRFDTQVSLFCRFAGFLPIWQTLPSPASQWSYNCIGIAHFC